MLSWLVVQQTSLLLNLQIRYILYSVLRAFVLDEWVYFLACREYICVFIWSPNSFACQLQKLKVEPVLLHYLSQIKVLQGGIIHLFSKNSVLH